MLNETCECECGCVWGGGVCINVCVCLCVVWYEWGCVDRLIVFVRVWMYVRKDECVCDRKSLVCAGSWVCVCVCSSSKKERERKRGTMFSRMRIASCSTMCACLIISWSINNWTIDWHVTPKLFKKTVPCLFLIFTLNHFHLFSFNFFYMGLAY